jgi:hypothetical protein
MQNNNNNDNDNSFQLFIIYVQGQLQIWHSADTSKYIMDKKNINKQTPWPLVRERTIPTERPPLVDEI